MSTSPPVARAGTAGRRRSRCRQAPRQTSHREPGCCAATARWPRARSGRHSSTPRLRARQPDRDPRRQPAGSARQTRSAGISTVRRARSGFGWHAIEIDGHDVEAIDRAYAEASRRRAADGDRRPHVKGKGVAAVETRTDPRQAARRREAPSPSLADAAKSASRSRSRAWSRTRSRRSSSCRATGRAKVATRKAYGEALAAIGAARGDVVALDGEVGNSTYAEVFARRPRPVLRDVHRRAADGRGRGGLRSWLEPFASTFAAFLTRATTSCAWRRSAGPCSLCGSHAGVSIGEDGPSQMGLEDIATIRAIHGRRPAPVRREPDREAGRAMADWTASPTCAPARRHPCSTAPTRSSRSAEAGRPSSDEDRVTIVAAGMTVHEALGRRGTAKRDPGAGDRPLLGQARRRRHAGRGGRGDTGKSSPSRTTGRRAASARRSSRPPRTRTAAARGGARGPGDARLGARREQHAAAGIDAEHIAAAARELVGSSLDGPTGCASPFERQKRGALRPPPPSHTMLVVYSGLVAADDECLDGRALSVRGSGS